jgi:phage terminase large subunit-like protein
VNGTLALGSKRYQEWEKAGHLAYSPGKSIDPSVVALAIAELVQKYNVLGLAYDRWRIEDLLREFDRIGFKRIRMMEAKRLVVGCV